MPTIYELATANEFAAYWNELLPNETVLPCEELFPAKKQKGLDIKYIKGSKGLPVVLKVSAFDVKAVPRARVGFEKLSAQMPYFKESMKIDEELRQELNTVIGTANTNYIEIIMDKVFDDEMTLLRGARARREMMRMMALTTGVISMQSNGQSFSYDYGVTHKSTVSTSWSNSSGSDPIEDIRQAKEKIQEDTGVVVTRAMCDGKTWRNIRNNEKVKKAIYVLTNGAGAVSDKQLKQYIMDELEIDVRVNDLRYIDDKGQSVKYMPADTFVLFPEGALGNTVFGTTPAESDLMTSSVANVSIVDTGVSINTRKIPDPVTVETIVSMICLPSFEAADQVYILDTNAES